MYIAIFEYGKPYLYESAVRETDRTWKIMDEKPKRLLGDFSLIRVIIRKDDPIRMVFEDLADAVTWLIEKTLTHIDNLTASYQFKLDKANHRLEKLSDLLKDDTIVRTERTNAALEKLSEILYSGEGGA